MFGAGRDGRVDGVIAAAVSAFGMILLRDEALRRCLGLDEVFEELAFARALRKHGDLRADEARVLEERREDFVGRKEHVVEFRVTDHVLNAATRHDDARQAPRVVHHVLEVTFDVPGEQGLVAADPADDAIEAAERTGTAGSVSRTEATVAAPVPVARQSSSPASRRSPRSEPVHVGP
jgi:hypothetical protein